MKHSGKMRAGIMRPWRTETAGQFSRTLSERSGRVWREGNEIALFSDSLTLTITGATPKEQKWQKCDSHPACHLASQMCTLTCPHRQWTLITQYRDAQNQFLHFFLSFIKLWDIKELIATIEFEWIHWYLGQGHWTTAKPTGFHSWMVWWSRMPLCYNSRVNSCQGPICSIYICNICI